MADNSEKIFIDKGDPFEYCFLMELETGLYSSFINDDELGPLIKKIKEILFSRLPQYDNDNIPHNYDLDNIVVRYCYSKCNFKE